MTPEQLLEDVARKTQILSLGVLTRAEAGRISRAALAVAIEACAQEAESDERILGTPWNDGYWRGRDRAASKIRSLKPKD